MKKLFILVTALFTSVVLIGCDTSSSVVLNNMMTSKESLVSLSYLSAGFLDMDTSDQTLLNYSKLAEGDEPIVEEELDEINIYVDLLKGFIENGSENFGNILEEVSDRPEFARKLTINVQEEVYILYYNVDVVTGEITGVFVIGDVEYEIVAMNSLEDKEEFDHEDDDDDEYNKEDDEDDEDDEDEYDDEDEQTTEDSITTEEAITTESETSSEEVNPDAESGATETSYSVLLDTEDLTDDLDEDKADNSEYKMELIARNGDDFIKITYKTETEGSESVTKFEIEKNISGVEENIEIKIKQEADEYKLEIENGDNSYEFKREVESGKTYYKLEYDVNGVEGEIKIFESVDTEGNLTYTYDISEGDKEKSVEKDEPNSSFDDDEDDQNEQDEMSFHM